MRTFPCPATSPVTLPRAPRGSPRRRRTSGEISISTPSSEGHGDRRDPAADRNAAEPGTSAGDQALREPQLRRCAGVPCFRHDPRVRTCDRALPAVHRRAALAGLASAVLATVCSPPPPARASVMAASELAPASCNPVRDGPADPAALSAGERAALAVPCPPATVRLDLSPDRSSYDPADPALRDAALAVESALGAPSVEEEERRWTAIVAKYEKQDAVWRDDLVGRALGNRGNARARQGRIAEALADYNASIALCPWSVDPVLNRGVALEQIGRLQEARRDYQAVLSAAPTDPAAWNNLGNVDMAAGDYQAAFDSYSRAVSLAPEFSFAAANRALALFASGERDRAAREMRGLLRRYPDFADMRAALAATLWDAGLEAEAEGQWLRVDDPRYRDLAWVRRTRRWPAPLADALERLVTIQSKGQ